MNKLATIAAIFLLAYGASALQAYDQDEDFAISGLKYPESTKYVEIYINNEGPLYLGLNETGNESFSADLPHQTWGRDAKGNRNITFCVESEWWKIIDYNPTTLQRIA
jgi:hypothetical protein